MRWPKHRISPTERTWSGTNMRLLMLLLSHFSRVQLLRPHRQHPTRLCCPWDSPGKNTGVGCHFCLQCMHACKVTSAVSDSVWPYGQQPTRLLCPWDSPGKNTGVSCHFLLPHETRPWEGLDWKQINKAHFEWSKFNEDTHEEWLERESSNSTLHLER